MPDCGLNLPCEQEVPLNQNIAALQISNTGPVGIAITGSNTRSPDPAVLGESSGGVGTSAGVAVQGTFTGAGVGEGAGTFVAVQGISNGVPFGVEAIGVQGQTDSIGIGVSGVHTNSGTGVQGTSNSGTGVAGFSTSGNGIQGTSTSGDGIQGSSTFGNGVLGSAIVSNGVEGHSDAGAASGVYGENFTTNTDPNGFGGFGVAGRAGTGATTVGVLGDQTGSGWAGFFTAKVFIAGKTLMASSGFQIDHPLEPDAKYLNHSSVESPDMKNIYDGIVDLDAQGSAWVELPAWFEALNRDFRYQLTPIGSHAPVYVAQEIVRNRFQIAGGGPRQRISWLVTGIRRDVWAEKNPLIVEEQKGPVDQGKFLNPLEAGHPRETGIPYARTRGLETVAEQRDRAEQEEKVRSGGKP